jgi:NADPH-dependent 2,4-dienoyl-CoA reductase/sulfur reductase-like enzyme
MRRLKRRSFLKLGGGAMASFFLPRVGGATGSTDCIIIGAGIAGLAAGDYLRKKGWGVTILEARERVGGRVWSRAHLEHSILFLFTTGKPSLFQLQSDLTRCAPRVKNLPRNSQR